MLGRLLITKNLFDINHAREHDALIQYHYICSWSKKYADKHYIDYSTINQYKFKSIEVFLFGLLSTPLPYILIASIYLLGFASGIFSSHEVTENKAQLQRTIWHEQIAQPEENYILFCDEFNKQIKEIDFELFKHSFNNEYDTGRITFRIEQIEIQSFCYSCDRFSRPPPFCLS